MNDRPTARELTDAGICPTCYNREHGGIVFGDETETLLYRDADIECFFVKNPRAPGHMCIASVPHYQDMSEAPDVLNEKIVRYARFCMRLLCEQLGCVRVYLCTMCDGPANHYHVQLIPRYPCEERGSRNFVKPRGEYTADPALLSAMRSALSDFSKTQK